jgi:hypothetical protein
LSFNPIYAVTCFTECPADARRFGLHATSRETENKRATVGWPTTPGLNKEHSLPGRLDIENRGMKCTNVVIRTAKRTYWDTIRTLRQVSLIC